MDSQLYKTAKTRRGFTYGYYSAPNPDKGKPTVLLIIGFPSTAQEWKPDYGVIAPDMLGYGGTDKPSDVHAYKAAPMANDMIDILDNENVKQVVIVSHDWAVIVHTRLTIFYPDRILANVFISLGCFPPDPNWSWEETIKKYHEEVGYDVFGYWEFHAADDTPELVAKNIDSYYSVLFPNDPTVWRTVMAPRGEYRKWVEANKQGPPPPYWTTEQRAEHQSRVLKGGFRGPFNWYKASVLALNNEDDAGISRESMQIHAPTLFVAATKDYICLPSVHEQVLRQYCDKLTVTEIDSDHWVMIGKPDELNKALGDFFSAL
ncbi:hypothetical protein M422DRAFT_159311 [Sphaerobolus stellatus SS14]|nr:hypothetical protein M422DRAFT_159311 [Sphaerobolus stellatus SS14]